MYIKEKLMKDINYIKNEKILMQLGRSRLLKDHLDSMHIDEILEQIDNNLSTIYDEYEKYKNSQLEIKDKLFIHYTSKDNKTSIINDGFTIPDIHGRFGHAIYFAYNSQYGYNKECKIEARLKGKILSIWHHELKDMFPEEDYIFEDSGCLPLKEYAINLGYDAVEIKYLTEVSEIAVYNTDIIKIT